MRNLFIKFLFLCALIFNAGLCFSQNPGEDNELQSYRDLSKFKNYGKSVAVFGGSVSSTNESKTAKQQWTDLLNMDVTTYGVGGAGLSIKSFSSSSKKNTSVPIQVRDSKIHDIYVIWNSTNDMWSQLPREDGTLKIPVKIGTPNDEIESNISGYPAIEMTKDWLDANLDSTELTVCAGLNYCIQTIFKKNPKAEIYLFTPILCFNKEIGYTNKTDGNYKNNLADYRDANVAVFKKHGLSFLDLYYESGFTKYNHDQYFKKDKLHLNESGYLKVSYLQVDFLENGR